MSRMIIMCDGCGKPIKDEEKNIASVDVGRIEFSSYGETIQDFERIWVGHRRCFDERFKA